LRAEILNRSNAQQAASGANLTLVGIVLGLALARHADAAVLLVIPPVSVTLGLIWLDHAAVIKAIGYYIAQRLWTWAPSWEEEASQYRAHWRAPSAGLLAPFIVPPAAALVAAPFATDLRGLWVVWACEIIVTLLATRQMVVFYRGALRPDRQQADSGPAPQARRPGA
jgi:hypothetical protein